MVVFVRECWLVACIDIEDDENNDQEKQYHNISRIHSGPSSKYQITKQINNQITQGVV